MDQSRHSPFGSGAPRVSVVMPTYNQAPFLEQAVESILIQTLPDFEFLIVDDGSTDDTPAILARLSDPRVHVIRQTNQRLPRALNAGFRVAHGEYVTWVSSDNQHAPTFLEELAGALDAYPDADFAYSAFHWMDAKGRVAGVSAWQDARYPCMLCANPAIAAFMYHRRCHDEVGWYAEDLEGAEDWDMWLRICERADPVYVTASLCRYRVHGGSMTSSRVEQIRRASSLAFHRGIDRLVSGSSAAIDRLYPRIAACQNKHSARYDACLDFCLRVLASPVGLPTVARRFLEAAHRLEPDSADVAFAFKLLEEWTPGSPLLERVVSREVERRSELLELEDAHRRMRRFPVNQPDPFLDWAPRATPRACLQLLARHRARVCIWGAGAAGSVARHLLRDVGVDPYVFIDSDPVKIGTTHDGVPVVSPARLDELEFAPRMMGVVVASVGHASIRVALDAGRRREGVDYVILPQETLDVFTR